jgi:hypothetical protein
MLEAYTTLGFLAARTERLGSSPPGAIAPIAGFMASCHGV